MDSIIVPLLAGTNTPWRVAVAYEAIGSPNEARLPSFIDWDARFSDFQLPGSSLSVRVGSEPRDLVEADGLSAVLYSRMMTTGVNFRDLLVEAGETQRMTLEDAKIEAAASSPRPRRGAICVTLRWAHASFESADFDFATKLLDSGLFLWLAVRIASAFALGPLTPIAGPARAVLVPGGEWVNLPRIRLGTPTLRTFDGAAVDRAQLGWSDRGAVAVASAVAGLDAGQWANASKGLLENFHLLQRRVADFASGAEPLAGTAYWCLTFLEETAGSRTAAARMYGVSQAVLKKLGRLSSTRGGRKVDASLPLGEGERYWLELALTRLLERVGLLALGIDVGTLEKINMRSLRPSSI